MATKSAKSEKRQRRTVVVNWRWTVSATLLGLLFMAGVFGFQQLELFLIRDARFVVRVPADYGEESPDLHVQGIKYASRARVLGVFRPDIGRSLYLLPLNERRATLLRLPWVKEASVWRTWPNQVYVKITERKPVAFVQLRDDAISRWSLIDADGIILDPPAKVPFQLPVITGVRQEEAAAMRGIRVRRMSRMLDDLGQLRERVSEVDTADLDDLKVTLKMKDRGVVLMLGDRNFHSRFQNFLDHYDEIQRRVSGATTLDLRLDDRITVIGGTRG